MNASIEIDISASDEDLSLDIAQDGPGDCYTLRMGDLTLTINHEQMTSMFQQIRPWFEGEE